MQYNKFGETDLLVSKIGFGAWAIGGGAKIGSTAIGWGEVDDTVSIQAIYAALDEGINFFDTADIYGLGHSEEILGKTVGKNKEVIIATKVGNVARNEVFSTDYSFNHIIQACENSLRRLKRDYIDFYQLHTARLPHLQEGECIEAMKLLQQQGKIRYWGLSLNTFEPQPEANYLMQQKLGDGFQAVLNLLNQIALPEIDAASKQRYGIIARMPLQFGLLSGKFTENISFPDNDHRKNRITNQLVIKVQEKLKYFNSIANVYGLTPLQFALSYVTSYQAVSVCIPGMRTVRQVKENTHGIVTLSATDLHQIEQCWINNMQDVWQQLVELG